MLYAAGINAQPFGMAGPGYRLNHMNYQESGGEKCSTLFFYDNRGLLCHAFWELADHSKSSQNQYVYDARGWLISAFRSFSDSTTSYEYFVNDSLGNITAEYFFRSDRVRGTADYLYDGGRIKEARFRNYKGWLTCVIMFRYDDRNRKVKGEISRDGKVLGTINYEYDQEGNQLKEHWNFSGWNQTFTFHYEKTDVPKRFYTSPFLTMNRDQRIISENYTYNNEVGGPSGYIYNANGLLEKKEFSRSDGFKTTTTFEYHADGRLKSSQRILPNGRKMTFSYAYDIVDHLINRTSAIGDSIAGIESYLYDAEGLLVGAVYRNVDGWLTGTLEFTHSPDNRLAKGTFKGEDGQKAGIHFTYNPEGLLAEIKWLFSDGRFQLYSFTYE